jgi:hypothetical protein
MPSLDYGAKSHFSNPSAFGVSVRHAEGAIFNLVSKLPLKSQGDPQIIILRTRLGAERHPPTYCGEPSPAVEREADDASPQVKIVCLPAVSPTCGIPVPNPAGQALQISQQ